MPFWGWLLVDLGVILAGVTWWAVLGLRVARAAQKTYAVVSPSVAAAGKLNDALEDLDR